MTKKRIFIILGLLIISSFFVLSSLKTDKLVSQINSWGINIDLQGFSVKDVTKDSTKEVLEGYKDTTIAIITKTKTDSQKKYIEDKKFLINSLFTPSTSPYPEVITNTVECANEFKPKIRNVENGTIYSLFASERLTYGVCVKDLIAYESSYGIFDCKKKGIFEVRIFSKTADVSEKIINSFGC